MFSAKQKKLMQEQIPEAFIHQLQGFDYLEGHYVIAKLNEIFGEDGWSSKILREGVYEVKTVKDPNRLEGIVNWCVFELTIHPVIEGENGQLIASYPVVKQDIGSSEKALIKSDGTEIGGKLKAIADNYKTAATDALKRTARQLGTAFGNMLYEGDFIHGDFTKPKSGTKDDKKTKEKAFEYRMKLQYPLDVDYYISEISKADTKEELGNILSEIKGHWQANGYPVEDLRDGGIIKDNLVKKLEQITPKLVAAN